MNIRALEVERACVELQNSNLLSLVLILAILALLVALWTSLMHDEAGDMLRTSKYCTPVNRINCYLPTHDGHIVSISIAMVVPLRIYQ